MYLLVLALAPGLAIMFYFYSKDTYDREPLKNLVISFLLGMVSIIPAFIIQTLSQSQLLSFFQTKSIPYYALFAFAVVGFGEELSKFIMLRYYSYRRKAFNEPLDGIIYSVMISMGFATLENIGYVLQGGYTTAIMRMFLSVPAHAAFGVLMGYHAGLAKFDPANSAVHLWKGLILAAFFHGAYDFFLFLQENAEVTKYITTGLLFAGAIVSYWIAVRMALRSLRLHQELSKQDFIRRNNNV